MKAIKELEQGLTFKHFNVKEKDYICVSSMLYVDLIEGSLLKEGAMWEEVVPFLREDEPLDFCMPKERAEFAAYGSAYSKTPTKAQEVAIKIGDVEKRLYVVGDRYYGKNSAGVITLSEPESFTQKKVGFINAYGGENYPKNPIGTGNFNAITLNTPQKAPNIQSVQKLAIDNVENIEPQSFEPLGIAWEFRAKKAGSYDNAWKNSRWPYLPQDTDYTMFNTTLPDQWMKDFFRGDEEIVIENMNKEYESIRGKLPLKKIRTFLTRVKREDYYSDKIIGEEFFEVENRLDSVIIFTDIARAVLIFRGVAEVSDDEFSDIAHIFLKTEALNAPQKELAYYKELRDRELDNSIDIESEQEALQNELSKMSKELSLMPMKFANELKKVNGEVPSISQSPSVALDRGTELFKNMQSSFDDIALEGITKYAGGVEGGVSKALDASFKTSFAGASAALRAVDPVSSLSTLYSLPKDIAKSARDIEASMPKPQINIAGLEKLEAEGYFKGVEDIKKKLGISIADSFDAVVNKDEDPFKGALINSWSDGARYFIGDRKDLLEEDSKHLVELQKIGLSSATIDVANICYNDEEVLIKKGRWAQEEDFEIKSGFVFGFFEGNEIKRLVLRERVADEEGRFLGGEDDEVVFGSSECELTITGGDKSVVVVVEDFLEAWFISQETWDFATIVASRDEESFYKTPFYNANKDSIKHIFTLYFECGMLTDGVKYSKLNFAKPLLNDPKKGEVRSKIVELLEDGELKCYLLREEGRKRRMGLSYIPPFDTEEYQKKMESAIKDPIRAGLKAKLKDAKAEVAAKNSELFDNNPNLKKIYDEFKATNKPPSPSELTPKAILEGAKKKLDEIASNNAKITIPEAKISEEVIANAYKAVNSPRWQDVLAINENVEKELAPVKAMKNESVFPDWAKKRFKKAFGKDIDAPVLKFKSFEAVREHYDRGYAFVGAEFGGVDFIGCSFKERSFKESKLDGTHFKDALFEGVDLQDASLAGALFEGCRFINVNLLNTNLTGAEFKSSRFEACVFDKSILKGCEIEASIFDNSSLKDIILSDATIKNSSFKNGDFKNALFTKSVFENDSFVGATFESALFEGIQFRHCDFEEAKIEKAIFSTCAIHSSSLDSAVLDKTMFVQGSSLEKVSAQKCKLRGGTFLGAKVEGSSFRGSDISGSYINKSAFKECSFERSDAKELRIERTKLENSSMQEVDMMFGSLRKTYLKDVNMSRSNLFSVDLFGLKTNRLNLKGSNLKFTYLTPERLRELKDVDSDYR